MTNGTRPMILCTIPATARARRPLEWAQPRLARLATTGWNFPCLVGRAPAPVVSSGLEQLFVSV
jgi:hypothetical protein